MVEIIDGWWVCNLFKVKISYTPYIYQNAILISKLLLSYRSNKYLLGYDSGIYPSNNHVAFMQNLQRNS